VSRVNLIKKILFKTMFIDVAYEWNVFFSV